MVLAVTVSVVDVTRDSHRDARPESICFAIGIITVYGDEVEVSNSLLVVVLLFDEDD